MVLGVFFLVAWGMRRATPPGSTLLPGEVFEVLGRAPMASRQQVHLLRCGRKLLLVSVTPAGAETLTEITEPMEVDRLAGLCQQGRSNSATAAFREVFQQFTARRSSPGLFGSSNDETGFGGIDLPMVKDAVEGRDV
ncbi:MAG: flagellar biosynthetic protein FliO [Pirellulales bacterium]|nr:flagellar biosynthetic protein FliO [Pirellulales bacterium]